MSHEFARITTVDGDYEFQCRPELARRMLLAGILRSFDGTVTTPDTLDGGMVLEQCYTVLKSRLRDVELACKQDNE